VARAVTIAFATTTTDVVQEYDFDRALHDEAFASAGLSLDHCVWWDPDVSWEAYDLVVIRSPWDYVERLAEFRHWLRTVDAMGTLRNPAAVVEWNLDKRYLSELADQGVPVIPTQFVSTTEAAATALSSHGGEVVVKPVVSAGSRKTGRFEADDPSALALADDILAGGLAAMIQPCVASVATSGEISAILFNGAISHAIRKGPILSLGGGFLGGRYAEETSPASLSGRQREVVGAAAAAVGRLAAERFATTSPLLYARIDLVTLDDGSDVVLEVELAEPTFFLASDPDAAGRFVSAVQEQAGGR
jgi:glutathione synthase/RimK-type ligase-like ATP-grasp enzyme